MWHSLLLGGPCAGRFKSIILFACVILSPLAQKFIGYSNYTPSILHRSGLHDRWDPSPCKMKYTPGVLNNRLTCITLRNKWFTFLNRSTIWGPMDLFAFLKKIIVFLAFFNHTFSKKLNELFPKELYYMGNTMSIIFS